MDYKQLATDILELVGGKENIKKVNKDYTNLRFILKDKNKAKKEEIEKLDGVKSVMITETHFNVMIGAKVPEVYKELINITGEFKEEKEVISEGAILNAKLKAIFKALSIPFVVMLVLYFATYLLSSSIPSNIYKFVNIAIMALWVVLICYFAYTSGKIFKINNVFNAFIMGVSFGINIYFLNIYAIICTIFLIIIVEIIAFKITFNKKKK